jgi:hypothetical protein
MDMVVYNVPEDFPYDTLKSRLLVLVLALDLVA